MDYRFSDLVDLKRVKSLMRLFHDLTGLPSTLIDLDGNILTTEDGEVMGVGWKRICLDFHRVHPDTCAGCHQSDTELANSVNSGGCATSYRCLNGLVDAASPVVIEGRHLLNLFTGQFLFEPPDEAEFRARARRHGFDEESYMAALAEIPVFTRQHVDNGLAFLDLLAGIIAEMGLKRQELIEVNQQIEVRIRQRTDELRRAKEAAEAAERLAAERAAELERREAELAQLYERLKDLDRAKTEFFSNVSHEFRTPLTLIAAPVERLLASGRVGGDERRDLEVVRTNANTLLKHVTDLLDVTKLDSGRMDIVYRSGDLAEIVRMVAGHFDSLAPERGIRFELSLPDSLPAEVDVGQVERIVLNLLSNAFKFTPGGGRVACSVATTGRGSAVLRVEDSGPGIPPEQRGLVFERFRQGDGGASRRFGGTGLGLAIVKDFVDLHGGRISVGDARGGGTVMEVELPLAAPTGVAVHSESNGAAAAAVLAGTLAELALPQDDEPASRSPGHPSGDGRPLALVVEDNHALRRLVIETLAGEFDVIAAADGEQGLAAARARRPDIVVADIMMPHLSGDRMIAALRADPALAEVPVLVLSAKADDTLRVELLGSGARDYLVKPFLVEELRVRAVNLARVARAGAILRHQLDSRDLDVARLAGELADRNRTLQRACTEMAVAREQAVAASQAKSRFLAMVSHELRSPLQNLEIYRTLLARIAPDAETGRLLAGIAGAAERMGGIVSTILHYSTIESGRITVAPAEVHLGEVVADVLAEVAERAGAKGLAIAADTPPLPPVTTDPQLVRLVLVNLVDNAVKYTERGRVTIAVDRDGAGYRCSVADTGIGIRAEDRSRIFEPFEQVEKVSHKHVPGVGLGLALVKNVAELLGGRIELESVPGQGSTFSLVLPAILGEAA